ncbi:MAG TPA: hypothetical protein PK006_11250 [Saprospiraceae bacterium]|nr:hypothetical protein [Saprospiraceae bacterium]
MLRVLFVLLVTVIVYSNLYSICLHVPVHVYFSAAYKKKFPDYKDRAIAQYQYCQKILNQNQLNHKFQFEIFPTEDARGAWLDSPQLSSVLGGSIQYFNSGSTPVNFIHTIFTIAENEPDYISMVATYCLSVRSIAVLNALKGDVQYEGMLLVRQFLTYLLDYYDSKPGYLLSRTNISDTLSPTSKTLFNNYLAKHETCFGDGAFCDPISKTDEHSSDNGELQMSWPYLINSDRKTIVCYDLTGRSFLKTNESQIDLSTFHGLFYYSVDGKKCNKMFVP